jgi:uncharacterized protein (UPF0276 family)
VNFSKRVQCLPHLGIGISTEYGANRGESGVNPFALLEQAPRYASFLELGVEVAKGLDEAAHRWVKAGRPTTYHFLDVNLDEPDDFDPDWVADVVSLVSEVQPSWLCGDAGLWHFGPREPQHMLLLPPILCDEAATELARGIVRLRELTGREVLPENPPGAMFVGPLHILDFFARVCERADTGMLLDLAHLAIFQRARGLSATAGLDAFPLERVVEVHVAGGTERHVRGYPFVEDDHTPTLLPETWELLAVMSERASELRAVVFECERSALTLALPQFGNIEAVLRGGQHGRRLLEAGGP